LLALRPPRRAARRPSAEWKTHFDQLTQDLRPGLQIFHPFRGWSFGIHRDSLQVGLFFCVDCLRYSH